MDDLIKRAREDDTDPVMLRKLADHLEAQASEIARLREVLAKYDRLHSCIALQEAKP